MVGLQRARHDFDEGGFAGAVIAHKAHNLRRIQLEVDPVERVDGAERLVNVFELREWLRLCFHKPPYVPHPIGASLKALAAPAGVAACFHRAIHASTLVLVTTGMACGTKERYVQLLFVSRL